MVGVKSTVPRMKSSPGRDLLVDTEADLITVQKLWMQREVLVNEVSNLCLHINATQLLDVGAIVSISSAVEEQPVVSLQPSVLETVINERLPQLLCLRALKSEPRKQDSMSSNGCPYAQPTNQPPPS